MIAKLEDLTDEAAGRAAFQLGRLEPKEGPALPALRRALKSPSPYVRLHAMLALLRTGEPALPLLVDAVEKGSRIERILAIQALANLAPLAKEPPLAILRRALGDDESAVRQHAASAIGNVGPRAAVALPDLIQLGRDDDAAVAAAAMWSLGRMGPAAGAAVPMLAERLAKWNNHSHAAMILTALGEIGRAAEPVIPVIVQVALENASLESNAFPALMKLGPAGRAAMVEIIRDATGHVRAFAIETLSASGQRPPGFRAALEKAVQDPNPRTRQAALLALPHVPADGELNVEALMQGVLNSPLQRYSQSHVPHFLAKSARAAQLIPYVKHEDKRARWAAWYALGLMEVDKVSAGDRKTLEPLAVAAATAKDSRVRWAATGYIAKFPPTRPSDGVLRLLSDSKLGSMHKKILAALVALDDPAPVIKALDDPNLAVRRGAAAVVQAYGPKARDAIPALRRSIEADPKQRYLYARVLIAMGDAALPALIALLPEAGRSERRTVTAAIAKMGDAALPHLRRVLKSGTDLERRQVVPLLGQIGEKALDDLIRAARDPDSNVRRLAYYQFGLKPQHAEKTIPVLVEGLTKPETTNNALDALRKIGPKALPWIRAAAGSVTPSVRLAAMKAGPTLGEGAVPMLAEGLKDADAKVRAQAAGSLAYLKSKAVPALPALRDALKDPEARVRHEAASAIAWTGPSAEVALPDLMRLFTTGTSADRRAVGKSLERIGAPSAPFLVRLLGKKDDELAGWVTGTLGRIGGPVASLLAAALIDGDERTRTRAGEALLKIRAPAVKPLAGLLDHKSHDVRRIAAWRLGQLKRVAIPAIPGLIGALKDANTYVVSQAAWALGEIGPAAEDALPELERLHKAGRHRAIVKDAMRKIRA